MEPKRNRKPASVSQRRGSASRTQRVVVLLCRYLSAARYAIARLAICVATRLLARLRRGRVAVEVLVVDAPRRRRIEREIRRALRQLRRGCAAPPVVSAIVVSEHVMASARELAGATHVSQKPGGGHTALIRLALSGGGCELGDDEVLAVLADQWLGLATQQGGPSVLVPVELPARAAGTASAGKAQNAAGHNAEPSASRRDDPLSPAGAAGANGHGQTGPQTQMTTPGWLNLPSPGANERAA